MPSPLRTALVLLAATLTVTACAARRPARVADRFVRHGSPAVDLGGQLPGGPTPQSTAEARKAAADAKPRPKHESPAVAETFDPRLKQRLTELQMAPSARTHEAVAGEYRRLGILDIAFRHLSAAIRMAPKDASLYDQRARIWRVWSLAALGISDARKAVRLAPRSATAWNTLGLLLEDSGQTKDAMKAYRRAVSLDVDAAYAWSNLCRAVTSRPDVRVVLDACSRMATSEPSVRQPALGLHVAGRLAGGLPSPAHPAEPTVGRR